MIYNRRVKGLLRNFLINFVAILATTRILPGLTYSGGIKTLALGALIFMVLNFAIVPILRIMLLPLNLLTFGLFAWIANVIALYLLTVLVPQFKLVPYLFDGRSFYGVILPTVELNTLQVAIVASFLIGFITHFLHWLNK